jgi:lysozyme
MIKGIDISHWQNKINWKEVAKDDVKFAIIKATEAVGYVDPTLEENTKGARDNGILLGFYHFARGNNPHKEADFFLSKLPKLQEGELLVLDYEINIVKEVEWCRMFLDRVFDKTGIRPILYTNEARVKSINWQYVIDGNYGLWVAKYGANNGKRNQEPNIGQWPFAVMWQYTSRGSIGGIKGNVDLNVAFVEDVETLKKYGKPKPKPENDEKDDQIEEIGKRLDETRKELEEEKEKRKQAERREEIMENKNKTLKETIDKIKSIANY